MLNRAAKANYRAVVLVKNEAVCALEFGGRTARFPDVDQVRRSARRLSRDNIQEDQLEVQGVFQGVLPSARSFELRHGTDDTVIRGKVSQEIEDAAAINAVVGQEMTATLRCRQVGKGRPRYVLLAYTVMVSNEVADRV